MVFHPRDRKLTRNINQRPTMYSPERQQDDTQSSRARKLGPSEDVQFERSKLHFHNVQISDCRYLEKVFKNLRKKVESRRRRTSNWYRSVEDQRIDLGTIYVDNDESLHPSWPNYVENLEVYRNTNFEELQNLFHITQKLMLNH